MEKNIDSVDFQHFSSFFSIFIANYPMLMCTLLEGEGVGESVCFVLI